MSEPKFCPNCGWALPDGPRGRQPFSITKAGVTSGGWDCYCDACSWSGDIMPDDEA